MKRLFIFLIFLYLVGQVSHSYFIGGIEFSDLKGPQGDLIYLLRALRDVPLFIVTSWAIIYSISYFGHHKKRFISISYLALSLGVVVSLIIYSHQLVLKFDEILEEQFRFSNSFASMEKEYEGELNDLDIPLSERMKKSNLIARQIYYDTGKSIKVLNQNGQVVEFTPAKELVSKRKERKEQLESYIYWSDAVRRARQTWIAILVVSIVIGLVLLLKRNYNKRLHRNSRPLAH